MRVAVDGVYFGTNVGRPPYEVIRLAALAGAEGVNWPLHPEYHADPSALIRDMAEAELAVVSLGLMPHLAAVPGSEREFRELVKRGLEAAETFDAPVLDVWGWRHPQTPKSDAQLVLASNLEAVEPLVAAAGRVLSIEFEPDTTLERYDEALGFVSEYGPAIRVTADTYHIHRVGDDLEAAGAALGGRIGIVHFSGSHRGEPCSEGDQCDYDAFLRAAVAAGFGGDVVLQYKPPVSDEETEASLKRSVEYVRSVVH
jgi:sugar phosphate isomerase/epimerase